MENLTQGPVTQNSAILSLSLLYRRWMENILQNIPLTEHADLNLLKGFAKGLWDGVV